MTDYVRYPWQDELRAFVNASATDDDLLSQCSATAEELVKGYVAGHAVPVPVLYRAAMEVAAELYHRRNAPGGITQFATLDGASPVRMARDPMLAAYPLLKRFLPKGLA